VHKSRRSNRSEKVAYRQWNLGNGVELLVVRPLVRFWVVKKDFYRVVTAAEKLGIRIDLDRLGWELRFPRRLVAPIGAERGKTETLKM